MTQPGTRYVLEVNPRLPKRLARMEDLAGNLWYSWDRPTRAGDELYEHAKRVMGAMQSTGQTTIPAPW